MLLFYSLLFIFMVAEKLARGAGDDTAWGWERTPSEISSIRNQRSHGHLNAINGLVKMPSETCTATREAMRKEDRAGR